MPPASAVAREIRSLSPRAETAFVLLLCFGPQLALAITALAHGFVPPLTNGRAAAGIAYELAAGGAAAAFLAMRGWNRSHFRLRAGVVGLVAGVSIAAVYRVASTIVLAMFGSWLAPSPERLLRPAGSTAVLLLFFAVDAVFEEVFANAYAVQALERLGVQHAIVWSAALRVSYGLYQGAIACAMIFAFGLAMAWVFRKYRNLGIPVSAHLAANALMILV
jgi:membrane protease YdiL (CAAX protease family)